MDSIAKNHAHRELAAHGIAVGLSDGLMGNSEVGYAIIPSHVHPSSYDVLNLICFITVT